VKRLICATLAALAIAAPAGAAPDEPIAIELNATETLQAKCRLSFVIANKGNSAFESLKLDLALFGRDGVVQRRLVTEMGPLRRSKTIIKAFEVDGDCAQLGSVLVNDITACVPGTIDACLERLTLSSRVAQVKLFK
jgi:hypothetical protein